MQNTGIKTIGFFGGVATDTIKNFIYDILKKRNIDKNDILVLHMLNGEEIHKYQNKCDILHCKSLNLLIEVGVGKIAAWALL